MSRFDKFFAGFSFRESTPDYEPGDVIEVMVTGTEGGDAVARIGDSMPDRGRAGRRREHSRAGRGRDVGRGGPPRYRDVPRDGRQKRVLIGLRETVFLVLSTRSFTLRRSVIRWLLVKPQPLAYK